ncbi:MAG: Glycerophosphoryl diester phosphodiesterase [uncultured Thermomicrobiales bacterium]|uniref:Glycerophosphoryl diester phosphodiesterase n=1 Tax=uncultured Thermomicrobiales bacterium TaxID=1645740 RepID=A0A6J4VE89_9BACT|nr:MAG: Glycerophosphoryl diester phosphodiesterase [uncultured Thermomicrobiales bacterium]
MALRRVLAIGGFLVLMLALATGVVPAAPLATLEGRAVLPADTFAAGPPAGGQIDPTQQTNGRKPPFQGQPVQGFSAVLDAGGGAYWAMPDNGFGAKANSGDFLLRVYKIRPDFKTASGGSGAVAVESFIGLRDPDKRIPFKLTNDTAAERLLTGADFDIESVRFDDRGDLWFGDEFGPWLLHTDATGKVLEAPIPLLGVKAAENATITQGETANLPGSGGFEGMAASSDGRTLYPMLEKALKEDADQRRRFIYTFDVASKRYIGQPRQYRVEEPAHAIGDLTQLDDNRWLVIERDNNQGAAAKFKQIFLLDVRRVGADGFLEKRQIIDLLAIGDPNRLSLPARAGDLGLGETFSFPFQTIEDVLPLGGGRLLILNDNNYPFSAGRNPGLLDDNEMIIVRVSGLDEGGQMPGLPNTGVGGRERRWAAGLLAAALLALLLATWMGTRRRPIED